MQLKTPEERIMELIDNPSMKKRARKEAASTMFGLTAVFASLKFKWNRLLSLWALRNINKALVVVCFGATVFFFGSLRQADHSYDRRLSTLLTAGEDIRSAMVGLPARSVVKSDLIAAGKVLGGGAGTSSESSDVGRLKKIILVGVLTERGTRRAVLEDQEEKTTVIVSAGDRYGEYRVEAVSDDAVTFSGASGTWILK